MRRTVHRSNADNKNLQLTEVDEELPSDAWFAGLFDGEGCIGFAANKHKDGSASFQLRLTLGNTNGQAVRFFQRRFGGALYVKQFALRMKMYLWYCSSKNAQSALAVLLDLLVIKRDQAAFALEYYKAPWRGRKRTETQHEIDKKYVDTVAALKRWQPTYWWEKELAGVA